MKVKGVIPKWRYPEASERELSRNLKEFTRDLVVRMRDKLKPMKFDASDQEIQDAEDDLMLWVSLALAAIVASLPRRATTVYVFNTQQWLKVAKASGGKAVPAVAALDVLGPTKSEAWYQEYERQWISRTRQALDTMAANMINDWSAKVRDANMQDKTAEQVSDIVENRFGVYQSWVSNRAAGIIGSWNSRLMRQRIKDAGVEYYIWRGMLDERERRSHVLLEGVKIPANADHIFPGEEYGCRCWAIPHFTTYKQGLRLS